LAVEIEGSIQARRSTWWSVNWAKQIAAGSGKTGPWIRIVAANVGASKHARHQESENQGQSVGPTAAILRQTGAADA
jgi:hypothetical protein